MDGKLWARVVMDGADNDQGQLVIDAINRLTAERRIKMASVMIGLTQILAQSITQAPPDVAAEVRAGIFALIDGYATRHAVAADT